MANLPSAKKRIKQNERNRIRNRARRAECRTAIKKLLEHLRLGHVDEARSEFVGVTKKLDQTAAKGTMHAKTVARRKSRLAKRINAAAAAASA